MRILRTSLTARLVLLLTLCISTTVFLTTAVEYHFARQEILREVEVNARATIDAAISDLEARLQSIEETTALFAEVLQQRRYAQQELTEMLREVVDERTDIFGAAIALQPDQSESPDRGFAPYYYYDPAGDIRYIDLAAGLAYINRDWYLQPQQQGRNHWSQPYFDSGGGEVLMATYSVPMYQLQDGRRQFYGVMTGDISLATLQSYIDRIRLGKTGFAFLLSTQGKLMAAPRRENLMQPLLDILPATQDIAQWEKIIATAVGGTAVSTTLPCHRGPGNCILKLAPLAATGWPVGVYYSEREMLAPLREYLRKALVSGAVTLALLLAGALVIARRIARPLTEMAQATAEIATGNFSATLPQTRSTDELGRLVHAFSLMQSNLAHYVDQLRNETAQRHRLEGELSAAAEIQKAMLPQGGKAELADARFSLWAALQPAKSVGGDLYTFSLQQDRHLVLGVGDVSDKGVPAALFMARAVTLLEEFNRERTTPSLTLARLNDDLARGNDNCMFVTLFLGCLDLDSLQLEFASAGHCPPALLRAGQCQSVEQVRGPALALAGQLEFASNRLQLQPGDELAIYTDGVDEAFNDRGEQFGEARFLQLMQQPGLPSLAERGEATFSAIGEHAGTLAQSDDIALVLLRLPIAGIDLDVSSGSLTRRAMDWFQAQVSKLELPLAQASELLLVLEEAITNIEKYAQLQCADTVCITLEHSSDQERAGLLVLQVTDPGVAFDPLAEAERAVLGADSDSAPLGGLGVHLLEALCDWHSYRRQGNRNILRLGMRLP